MESNRSVVYEEGVLIGNWYETSCLKEDKLKRLISGLKSGDSVLAKYRKMTENLMSPTVLTQSPTSIWFGAKISLKAPLVPASSAPSSDKTGVLVSGFLTASELQHTQRLAERSGVSGSGDPQPRERSTFLIASPDYCDRDQEKLKYNQDFVLVLASSAQTPKPLYLRYDPVCVPEMPQAFPVFLSEFPTTNVRWRVLPKQSPAVTRFELEGELVHVNKDVVINHSATNTNLAADTNTWSQGFYGMECSIIVKNFLDVYKCETAKNLWHIHSYIPETD